MNIVHDDYPKVKTQIADRNAALIAHLHRGGALAFIQAFEGDKRRTAWYPVGKPLTPPAAWAMGQNLFFGVNPSSADEPSRWRHKDGTKDTRGTYRASTNNCIAAINCLYAEFDGKDFTQPPQDEITAQFERLKAADLASVASGQKAKQQPDKALWNQALGAAKDAKFATNPDHYKALAKAHVDQVQPRPSVIVFSGGGWQAYWLLRDTFHISDEAKRHFAKALQADWVSFVGGDPGAKDLRRILRLPGYKNYKSKYAPNYPTVSYEAFALDRQYSLTDLAALIQPKPVEQPATTTHRRTTNGDTPHTESQTADKHGLIDWFNANTPIGDILSAYGYTGSGDRMSRPGQPESNGVHIFPDNRSYHHSSNDPLWNDGNHKRSPFDVFCTFEHDGNVKAALDAYSEKFFGDLRLWIRTTSFEQHIDPALRGAHYRTDATDTRCADAILDVMEQAKRTCVQLSTRIGGKLAGVGRSSFERALERLQFIFEVSIGQYGYVVTLRKDTFLLGADEPLLTKNLKSRSVPLAPSKNAYTPHKADEAFMAGTSQLIKRRMAELAKVLEITDREAKAKYSVKALGETMLRCFDAWQRCGEMTVNEFAEETGKKIGSIRTALQYAVRLELASFEQEHQKAPKVYSFDPDFWLRVDELRPNLRSYTLTEQRENDRLKGAQLWAHRGIGRTTEEEQRKKLNLRLMHAASKRMKLLEVCYADKHLTQEEIARLAFDAQAAGGFAFVRGEKMGREDARSALRATVADLKAQGVTGKEAKRMLLLAGFTQDDLRPSIVGAL